jgi:hypothetical protein
VTNARDASLVRGAHIEYAEYALADLQRWMRRLQADHLFCASSAISIQMTDH